jgi:hippurate hydrolase
MGATCELRIAEGYPATINDPEVTEVIRAAGEAVLGAEHVIELPFDPWAEDFGYLTARVPGSMFWLGVTGEKVPNPIWHSPTFDLDEAALPVGAAVLAASALRLMKEKSNV